MAVKTVISLYLDSSTSLRSAMLVASKGEAERDHQVVS